jgi:hypothetical protein
MATAIDAKGDLIAGTGADAFSRIAVGSNTAPLVADSAEATGLRWDSSAWTSYTPTFSAAGIGAILGNGTVTGFYKQRGKTIQGRVRLVAGSTTTFGSFDLTISTPTATLPASGIINSVGTGYVYDTSGATYYQIYVDTFYASKFSFRCFQVAFTYSILATVQDTVPFTWATGDTIDFYFSYEVA